MSETGSIGRGQGVVRVGGGFGEFLGWPRSPSPPLSKEQRGEGGLLRAGGGFVVKGGGGGC